MVSRRRRLFRFFSPKKSKKNPTKNVEETKSLQNKRGSEKKEVDNNSISHSEEDIINALDSLNVKDFAVAQDQSIDEEVREETKSDDDMEHDNMCKSTSNNVLPPKILGRKGSLTNPIYPAIEKDKDSGFYVSPVSSSESLAYDQLQKTNSKKELYYSSSGSLQTSNHSIQHNSFKSLSSSKMGEPDPSLDAHHQEIDESCSEQIGEPDKCEEHVTNEICNTSTNEDPTVCLEVKTMLDQTNDSKIKSFIAETSFVSEITFDGANLLQDQINVKEKIEDKPEKGIENGNRRIKKSKRLDKIYEKVLELQRENEELKKENERLHMDSKLYQDKQQKQDERNSERLDTITAKVANLQSENFHLNVDNKRLYKKLYEIMGNHTDDYLHPIQNDKRICSATVECDDSDDCNSTGRGECEEENFRLAHSHEDDCTEVESKSSAEQRSRIESLERQLQEKITRVNDLEAHIKDLNDEMIQLRQSHEEEQRQQKEAYIELKRETTQIVTWLKRKIGQANPQHNDNDDDSLTPSERQNLAMEIEGEMVDWKKSLVVSSNEEMIELNIHSSDSIDESTVTNPLSPI
ncbi:predicted protein [Chaetoceros tenuissimus]|uniref:Uncharacterized protein n=1 Tax=Chaetoceros tenuissimus TaxID=426638 RepID=A0AAD3H7W1_9STRA|nr:predicted protein [Chaetoceros tenuissimus]